MSTATDLAKAIRDVYLNGRWIAQTNYQQELAQVTLAQAVQKTGELNTIAALTFHIDYYLDGLLSVMAGGPLQIRDALSYTFTLPQDEAEWMAMKALLFKHAESFAAQVEGMSEAQLQDAFVDIRYGTWKRNIEAVIEHGYYHLGQIVLLRKMQM